MYTVWHADKYKITFKLVIDHWPRAQYRAAARRLRNTALDNMFSTAGQCWSSRKTCKVHLQTQREQVQYNLCLVYFAYR
jgi:hypothetical protein